MRSLLRVAGKGSGCSNAKSVGEEFGSFPNGSRCQLPQVIPPYQLVAFGDHADLFTKVFYLNISRSSLSMQLEGSCLPSSYIEFLTRHCCVPYRGELCRDLKSYQDVIATFNCPALPERFEFIRQLGNVFLVRPEILATYITDNYLGRIDSELLQPYLAQRSDRGLFEKIADGTGGEEIAGPEAKGFRERRESVEHDDEGARRASNW